MVARGEDACWLHPLERATIKAHPAAPRCPRPYGRCWDYSSPLHYSHPLAPKYESLFDDLCLLVGELPVEAACHFSGFLFAADAHDGAGQGGLSEDPGNGEVDHLFVMVLGYGLEGCSELFEPGKGGFLGEGASTAEILRVQTLQVKAVC